MPCRSCLKQSASRPVLIRSFRRLQVVNTAPSDFVASKVTARLLMPRPMVPRKHQIDTTYEDRKQNINGGPEEPPFNVYSSEMLA